MNIGFMIACDDIPKEAKVTGLTGNLEDNFQAIQNAGFKFYELMIADPYKIDSHRFRGLESTYTLKPFFLCTGEMAGIGGFSLNHVDREKKKRSVEAFKAAIKVAACFGVNTNVGRIRGTIGEDGEKKSLMRLGESLQEINQYITAESLETRVLIEPLRKDICPILNNCAETGVFISEFSLSKYGILLDSDHMDYETDKKFLRSDPEMIQHVHLADSFHVPLGKGTIDFERFFDLLQSAEYRGNYSVEVFCQDNPFGVVSDTVTYLRRYSIFREELT